MIVSSCETSNIGVPIEKRINQLFEHKVHLETMQSIFFPPLLSLEDCPDNNKEGASSMTTPMRKDESNKQDSSPKDFFPSWSQDDDLALVHDCGVPLSEGRARRHPLPTNENTAGCLHQSQSMPSFERITLQMSESNNNVAGADSTHVDHHDDAPASAAAEAMDGEDLHHDVPFPTCIPKLRIRRIASEIDLKLMPSPLARRGGKEVEYLQKQLKAEALIRRKQELHNEQRKMRKQSRDEGGNNNDCIGISTLIEEDGMKNNKFSYAQKPHRRRHSRSSNKSIDNNNCNFMDLAASPPAILKNFSFKRSVSEALNDSDLPPEDANLLFTPMGRPLRVDDENDVAAASTSEEVFTMDEDVSVAASSDDENEEATGDVADDDDNDDEDDVELPPSLVVSSEAHNQLGGSPHDRNSPTFKKITLRPKMKVRADSTDFSSPMGTYAYKSTDQNKVATSDRNEQRIEQDTKAEKTDNSTASNKWKYVSPQKSRHGRLASQKFLSSASESFDALTLEDIEEAVTNESMPSRTRMNSAESDLSDRGRDGLSPSFSESNYATPDNSHSGRQSVRARKWSMSQMPNLPLASSPYHEMDFSTPGSAIGLPSQLPTAPLFCSSIDEEAVTPSLPSMEQPSFNTPHHSFAPNRASRGNNLLSIPQFAELVVPQLVSPTKPTAENNVPPSGEEKKEESDEDEPRELDLESQFAVFSKTPQ